MPSLFKNYSLLEVMCIFWLDSTRLIPSRQTQITLVEMTYTTKSHTPHTEKDNFRKGIPPFLEQLFFYQLLPFYGKLLNLSFLGKFRKLEPPPL